MIGILQMAKSFFFTPKTNALEKTLQELMEIYDRRLAQRNEQFEILNRHTDYLCSELRASYRDHEDTLDRLRRALTKYEQAVENGVKLRDELSTKEREFDFFKITVEIALDMDTPEEAVEYLKDELGGELEI